MPRRTVLTADALGRAVVVDAGAPAPPGWEAAQRVVVSDRELDSPQAAVAALHAAWRTRTPVVIELGFDASVLQVRETCESEPYMLDPSFEFSRERLAFLVWANSYDARARTVDRHGGPVWWWAHKAAAGAGDAELDGPADLRVSVGGTTYDVIVDGGPRGDLDMASPAGIAGSVVWHREEVERGAVSFDRPTAQMVVGGLAEDQLACVTHRSGPLRVIAPAGSGKTRTLTARIRHLVADRSWSGAGVCAVAYNNKAAAEMRERLGGDTSGVRVSTMHSLSWRLLNQFGSAPRLVEGAEVRRRLSAAVGQLPRGPRVGDPLVPYLDALSQVRLQLLTPASVEARRDDVPGFADAYETYTAGLRADNVVDFDAQIYEALRLLLVDPDARTAAQRGCRHLLVDEFQDLNPAYLLLVRLLSAPSYAVFGVGDDDQVLYSHAGATPQYLIGFGDLFPGAAERALQTNYRCDPRIVAAADALLRCNTVRIPKTIHAAKPAGAGSAVDVVRAPRDSLATRGLDVVAGLLAGGVPASQVAVLARVNAVLLPVQVTAADRGIPVASSLGPNHLGRPAIRTALSYLRVALSDGEVRGEDLAAAISQPKRRLWELRQAVERRDRVQLSSLAQLSNADRDEIAQFQAQLAGLRRLAAGGATTGQLLDHVCDTIGLAAALAKMDSADGAAAGRSDDLRALRAAAVMLPDPETFEAGLRGAMAAAGAPDAVQLLSVHRSKGLEWDHVVVVGVNEPLMPHQLATDIEEERRIMHVALTRARMGVTLVVESGAEAPFLVELDPQRSKSTPVARVAERPARGASSSRASNSGRPGPRAARTGRRHAGGQPRPSLIAAERPRRRTAAAASSTSSQRREVAAGVGMRVTYGGRGGRVAEIGPAGADVEMLDGATVRVRWGVEAVVNGQHAVLVQPSEAELLLRQRVAARIRGWRDVQAAERGCSASKVLADRDVELLASVRPADAAALSDLVGAKRAGGCGQVVGVIAGALAES